ncbi:HAD family hydrolase [Streptomyces sp. NRRL F-4489]|uniref:HAD family hydrolase n=1 Tax=Streptomyces sp. NRRL F-4489 TaxID=1609095 RepID=UPI0007495737|nr:HAD family phosphatase [Streptomyces sp. NRRL F-4489]KUL38845.1 HAD family hydrolase [Streptomyces sp. NRRL F-4489]
MRRPAAAPTPGGTVLFDLFGVLARHQSPAGRQRLVRAVGGQESGFWDAYWALRPPYDRGESDGPAYWRQVAARMGIRLDDARIAELIAADIESWSAVDGAMVALVGELAARGTTLGLLSNIPEELARHYEGRHAWLGHFRVRAFSCRIGHAKPEPAAYRWCQEALPGPPENVLFVDDRPENVRAAEAVGMRGHHFTGEERLRAVLAGWGG